MPLGARHGMGAASAHLYAVCGARKQGWLTLTLQKQQAMRHCRTGAEEKPAFVPYSGQAGAQVVNFAYLHMIAIALLHPH